MFHSVLPPFQAQIKAALQSSLRFAERQEAELRAQELVGEALSEEVMRSQRMEASSPVSCSGVMVFVGSGVVVL